MAAFARRRRYKFKPKPIDLKPQILADDQPDLFPETLSSRLNLCAISTVEQAPNSDHQPYLLML